MDLPDVAAELYALPPDRFVATRDGRAAEARKGGDRALATEIKKLRRPTVGAWLVNLLVRERPSEVDQLLALGAELRDAQSQLDAGRLRRLAQQRHGLVGTLVEEAATMAGDRGQAAGASARREAEETLEAALADPAAADALRSGRLTVALHYSGFGTVDLTDAVAAQAAVPPPPSAPARTAKAATKASDADRRRRERREAAEQEHRAAEAAAVAADDAVEARRKAARELAEARDRQAAEIADIERRLAELRPQHDEAVSAARAADAELADAEQAAAAAHDRADRAAADRLEA